MPPRRSSRPSINASGADDITHLSLPEVRDRLKRNTALLSSPIFASPSAPNAGAGGSANAAQGFPGSLPNSSFDALSPTRSGPSDPVRDKLLMAREALLAREQELMFGQMSVSAGVSGQHPSPIKREDSPVAQGHSGVHNGSQSEALSPTSTNGTRRESEGYRSGKARVLERIKASEGQLAKNGLILPIDQTLTLSNRDYQNATASALSHLSLNHTRSSSPKHRRPRPLPEDRSDLFSAPLGPGSGSGLGPGSGAGDEIDRAHRLARVNAFMSYKGDMNEYDDDDDNADGWRDDDDDEDDGDDDVDEIERDGSDLDGEAKYTMEVALGEKDFPLSGPAAGGYDGNGLPDRRVDAIGEEVDEYGEDDEVFAEGNDEYGNGLGGESMDAAPGKGV
ncbi:hypothetical protein IAU60_005667 [Kwoniella sp. DSM 27419]